MSAPDIADRLRALAGWMKKYSRSGGNITDIEVRHIVREMDDCADALASRPARSPVLLTVLQGGRSDGAA